MPDDGRIHRQWILLRLLAGRRLGVTLREMSEELEVSSRTLQRDLKVLRTVFPLDEVPGPRGRKTWKLQSGDGTPDLIFAVDEALALYLGRRFLQPLAGTLIWEAAQSAFKKIRTAVGKPALDYLEKMAARLHPTAFGMADYSGKSEIIDRLLVATEDAKVAIVLYQSLRSTEPVEYELEPLGLAYHKGALYLVAHSRDHRELRHFKVDRISDVEISRFAFQRPADFDIRQHLAGSFGIFQGNDEVQVKIRFSPAVARYVQEHQWHASQQVNAERDGSLVVGYRLSSTEEVKRWVLSFGKEAEVLEPGDLRTQLRDEVNALRAMYAHKEPRCTARR